MRGNCCRPLPHPFPARFLTEESSSMKYEVLLVGAKASWSLGDPMCVSLARSPCPVASRELTQSAEAMTTQGLSAAPLCPLNQLGNGFSARSGAEGQAPSGVSGSEGQAGFPPLCCAPACCCLFATGCLRYSLLFLAISQKLL